MNHIVWYYLPPPLPQIAKLPPWRNLIDNLEYNKKAWEQKHYLGLNIFETKEIHVKFCELIGSSLLCMWSSQWKGPYMMMSLGKSWNMNNLNIYEFTRESRWDDGGIISKGRTVCLAMGILHLCLGEKKMWKKKKSKGLQHVIATKM